MTITFTRGADSFSPWDRIGFESRQDAATVSHKHLDGSVGYDLAPDLPQEGTLKLLFLSAAEVEAARLLLIHPGPWVVADDTDGVSMTIVRKGPLGKVQQDARLRWMLELGWAEVPA